MVGMVLGVMPADVSPGHMPTRPSDLPSFLLRRLLSHGIHLGGQQGEWRQSLKLDKAFLACLDMYQGLTVQGYLWWGCRSKIPNKTKVDSDPQLCPPATSQSRF